MIVRNEAVVSTPAAEYIPTIALLVQKLWRRYVCSGARTVAKQIANAVEMPVQQVRPDSALPAMGRKFLWFGGLLWMKVEWVLVYMRLGRGGESCQEEVARYYREITTLSMYVS